MSDLTPVEGITVEGLAKAAEPGGPLEGFAELVKREVRNLYPEVSDNASLLVQLFKAADSVLTQTDQGSRQPVAVGTKATPFDFSLPPRLKVFNVHHSACVYAKVRATVGLGHKEAEKVEDVLDPLCRGSSWHEVALKADEDRVQVGNGYIEVVRGSEGNIAGLHHVPAADVRLNLEDQIGNVHYEVRGGSIASVSSQAAGATIMILFGDRDDFKRRHPGVDVNKISEIIHIREASSTNRWYGFPSWLAAVSTIELVQALHQHQFDFHINRGVPEFLLFLMGARADKKTWDKLTQAMQGMVGIGNSHRSGVFNITDPAIKVQVEKLAMDGIANGTFFQAMSETLSVGIVSAHRVPSSLAGIMIPGKVGAANETTNAILAFQALVVGPDQKTWMVQLGTTLGNPEKNGGLGLGKRDFAWRTIVEEMAETMKMLQPADTAGRMRQGVAEAAAEGRDLNQGPKD